MLFRPYETLKRLFVNLSKSVLFLTCFVFTIVVMQCYGSKILPGVTMSKTSLKFNYFNSDIKHNQLLGFRSRHRLGATNQASRDYLLLSPKDSRGRMEYVRKKELSTHNMGLENHRICLGFGNSLSELRVRRCRK